MNKELEKLLEKEWYSQGFAGKPVFLAAACSIDVMHKGNGFSYNAIFMNYKNDYCSFNYLIKDLEKHADLILKKLKESPKYLENIRKQYDTEVAAFGKDFEKAKGDLSKLSERELFALTLNLGNAIETTVGTAHIIESISLRLGDLIRSRLAKLSSGKELNGDFSVIGAPLLQSYLSKKEELLWKIKNASSKGEKEKLAEKFLSEFFWVKTSFVGSTLLSIPQIIEEADGMVSFSKPDFVLLKKQKEKLFKKYSLSEYEKNWVFWIEFLADWQDERKENMFKTVFFSDRVLREISIRYNVEMKLLEYLLPREITPKNIKSRKMETVARERLNGCTFVKRLGKVRAFVGEDFFDFEKAVSRKEEKDVRILTGTAVSLGIATGRVQICSNIDSLKKVEQGDILVASMTRPDYLLAMKKAAAIVTDEGGITCHAAIVSRELGIPCIIGTKIATKVLRDGWIVQVKANHGQVLVLKKS